MKTKFLLLLGLFAFGPQLFAQDDKKPEEKKEGWTYDAGIGLDFAQLLLINPKVGAGENKIAFGGSTTMGADYKKGRLKWENSFSLNFGVQRLGASSNPFQKALDELRFSSFADYKIVKDKPWGYALDFTFLSQLTPTYEGNVLSYKEGLNSTTPRSQFFSPATMTISPSISYKPDDHLSVLVSPASLKSIIVADDSIAAIANADASAGVHGTPYGGTDRAAFIDRWGVRPTGMTADSVLYANHSMQLGATIKVLYKNKFFLNAEKKPRLGVKTSLTLFSDYLNNPQNIDVEWLTTTDLYIFKGLSISLNTIVFYDHDVQVQLDRDNDPDTGVNGYESTGRRVSVTESLLIKYNFLF
ncbi:Protein of unknown function (DUF3078) [Saprospira grandis DSM 2844]|uniref:DUF3078 domain-containing protein n=1 Tax=Saprospira grandis DSM 2844 TaxID=694433 RepID=J0NZ72_9BACT|nr:DUF3078 domain-containing protein [Saprospira grandis]EJF52829.1 Protein of unknown function (DUF3078) [Saprospira grandis DSM 2844]